MPCGAMVGARCSSIRHSERAALALGQAVLMAFGSAPKSNPRRTIILAGSDHRNHRRRPQGGALRAALAEACPALRTNASTSLARFDMTDHPVWRRSRVSRA